MENAEFLKQLLLRCWSERTSADPLNWQESNPAWGQCAITACSAQDCLGGDIRWVEARTPDRKVYSHYYNILPDGTVFDATREQFPQGTIFAPENGTQRTTSETGSSFPCTRSYILSFPATQMRYMRLMERVEKVMGTRNLPGLFQAKNCECTSQDCAYD